MIPTASRFRDALIVEDEPHLGTALRLALGRIGLNPRVATNLAEARLELARHRPDLVLLDRKLPDGDSIPLCRALRSEGFSGMILMLTAIGDPSDRVAGLRSGADDYLPKPFSWEELSARIEALERRAQLSSLPPLLPTEPPLWASEPERLRVLGPKGWVQLTPLEFKLADHLLQAKGAIVSRDELLRSVWGFTLLPKTRTVDLFVGRLRKAFEENPEEPRHFLTIRGAGYRFQI